MATSSVHLCWFSKGDREGRKRSIIEKSSKQTKTAQMTVKSFSPFLCLSEREREREREKNSQAEYEIKVKKSFFISIPTEIST